MVVFWFALLTHPFNAFSSKSTKEISTLPVPDNTIGLNIEFDTICLGESTKIILLSSEIGVDYQLLCDDISVESPFAGTGSQIEIPVTPNKSCSYQVFATNTSTNESILLSDDVKVEVVTAPLDDIAIDISNPQICIGENTVISLDSSESGISYQLYDGTYMQGNSIDGTNSAISFPEFSPFRSVIYHIIATNNRCGSSVMLEETAKVLVGLPPEDHLHPTIDKHTICQGEEIIVSLTPTDPAVSYQLFDGDTPIGTALTGNSEVLDFQPTIPNQSTTYRIEALGDKCILPIDIRYAVDVDVHHPPLLDKELAIDHEIICTGEEVHFSIENSEDGIFYQLHDGSNFLEPNIIGNGSSVGFPSLYPTTATSYTVYAHESVCSDMVLLNTSKQISIIPIGHLSLENFTTPEEVCLGESIDIELPTSILGVNYILMDGNLELETIQGTGEAIVFEVLLPNDQSDYKISIGNCAYELIGATPQVTVHPTPNLQILTKDVTYGNDGQITLGVSDGTAPYTYVLEPGGSFTSDERVFEINDLASGKYEVLVVDANFCRTSESGESVEIHLTDGEKVIVSNALTPNGDGINDKWMIQTDLETDPPEVTIFNIYGQKIYHSKSYNNDWNGSYNGVILPNGAYYYLIEYNSDDIKPLKGTISILGNY